MTLDSNTVNCLATPTTSTYPTTGTIGLDIGGLWYFNYGSTLAGQTGGEKRAINQQNQSCLVGMLLGSQANDRVETKVGRKFGRWQRLLYHQRHSDWDC